MSDAAASAQSRQARAFGDLALHEAVAAADDLVRDVNRYLQVASPWDLARNGQVPQVQAVLEEAVKGARVAAELYAPIIPRAAAEASRRLADGPEVGEPLFPRVRVDNSLLV
ncbi:MAG: hypothetical protein JO318_05740 [Chloroflexi bacterium]|nr:hypothetical protein [Chloroflexota bacterium]